MEFYHAQVPWVQSTIGLTLLVLAALIVNFVLKPLLLRAAAPYIDSQSHHDDKAAAWLATVIPLLIVSRGIALVPHLNADIVSVVRNVAQALIVVSVAMSIVKVLSYLNEVYDRMPRSKNRPIKGFVQVAKIIVLCGAAIIMVSVLIDESPLLLLSGLGAITAVLLLVFKDTILSLVASVQLTTNDMLRRGDWISMPSMQADGDVIDISLHTVTVQNFDKTIVFVPTHKLVSDSYINWRGMQNTGGRRIKRSIPIDQNSIRFLTDDEVTELERFVLLRPHIEAKRQELAEWNAASPETSRSPVNARRLTNIGLLRAYAIAYMKQHPKLKDTGFMLMARQLAPTPQGLPLELYCFTDTTVWPEYEAIQSDVFDHMLAIVPEFGLRVFQEPSGLDFKAGLGN